MKDILCENVWHRLPDHFLYVCCVPEINSTSHERQRGLPRGKRPRRKRRLLKDVHMMSTQTTTPPPLCLARSLIAEWKHWGALLLVKNGHGQFRSTRQHQYGTEVNEFSGHLRVVAAESLGIARRLEGRCFVRYHNLSISLLVFISL